MAGRLDYRNYTDVFGNGDALPYDQHVNRDIESKRKSLGGVLFVDRVFTALGLTKAKLYPPKDTRALHDLFQQIQRSEMTTHHKLSALYYLLLDHDEGVSARSKIAETFALRTGMSKRYQIFMSGLWHMDRLHFGVALEYLAHPSLLPEFADNIVTVLVRYASGGGDYSLALAYVAAVRPVLKTPEAVELLFEAMARTDVSEAFYYTRTQPDPVRQQLFERLILCALKPSAPSASSSASATATTTTSSAASRATELVSLPFDADEEAWLRAFLTAGEGRKLKGSKDTMIVKKIVSGDLWLSEAAVSAKSISGPWSIILQGFRNEGTAATSGGDRGEQ